MYKPWVGIIFMNTVDTNTDQIGAPTSYTWREVYKLKAGEK